MSSTPKNVGIDRITTQIHKRTVKKGLEFNIMVVGCSGLGKSTFINSLFCRQLAEQKNEKDFEHPPKTVTVTSNTHDISENGINVRLTLVDTPGFGDMVNNEKAYENVIQHIDTQFWKYLGEEKKLKRRRSKLVDTRIHCCLYFIAPTGHGLKQIDVECMRRLHKKVNLIPVIGKADTLTKSELQEFKTRISAELAFNKIKVFTFYNDDGEELEKSVYPPFAVVGSDTYIDDRLARVYPWGTLFVEESENTDFHKMRELVIGSHLVDLKEITDEELYEAFRADKLTQAMQGDSSEMQDWELKLQENEFAQEREEMEKRIEEMEYQIKVREMEYKAMLVEQDADLKQAKLMELADEIQEKVAFANGEIVGLFSEGGFAKVIGTYKGCEVETCQFKWEYQVNDFWKNVGKNSPRLGISKKMMGCQIRAVVTPKSKSGEEGEEVTLTSSIRSSEAPLVEDLIIKGTRAQGCQVKAECKFVNTKASKAKIQWFRMIPGETKYTPIAGATAMSYTLQQEDVGGKVRVEITPSGARESFGTIITGIQEAQPFVEDFKITGAPEVGNMLTASGSYENCIRSRCQFKWKRVTSGKETVIEGAKDSSYLVTDADIGSVLCCEVLPVGSEGKKGEVVKATFEKISSSKPEIKDLKISGRYCTDKFTVSGKFAGGSEGNSEVTWFIVKDGSKQRLDGKGKSHQATVEDVGHKFSVNYVPVSASGTKGKLTTVESNPIKVHKVISGEVDQFVSSGSDVTFPVTVMPGGDSRNFIIGKDQVVLRQKKKKVGVFAISSSIVLMLKGNDGLSVGFKEGPLAFTAESPQTRDAIYLILLFAGKLKDSSDRDATLAELKALLS